MGKLAAQIEKAFDRKKLRAVPVPEWDMTLYVYPLTLRQLSVINAEKDNFSRIARQLVVRAKDADGAPLFDEEDFEKLCSHGMGPYGPEVVARVVVAMQAGDESAEDAEKN